MGLPDYQDIKVEDRGSVRTLSFDRERDMNRIRVRTLDELREAIDLTASDGGVSVVVITGKGRSFAAGVSLDDIEGLSVDNAHKLSRRGHELCDVLSGMNAVSVAAINGFCFGGGAELALACDIRIASERMKIGQPEITLGIMPGFGATQRLPRIVGHGVAADLILSGEIIDAQRALDIGLVSRIFPSREFEQRRIEFADQIASNAPHALSLAKRAVRHSMSQPLDNGLTIESELFSRSFETDEPSIGIEAFRNKTRPVWDKRGNS